MNKTKCEKKKFDKNVPLSIVCLVLLLMSSSVHAVVVYSNDFNSGSASLSDFTVGTISGNRGPYSVDVVSGQLQISTGLPMPCYGCATINKSHFSAPYSSTLKNNPGLVTWSFNVSNEDGQFNNWFGFALATDAVDALVYTSNSYVFGGGGYVRNRMVICRNSPSKGFDYFIDVQDGLPSLPSKGSIRITYEPSTGLWSLYGEFGDSYVDPMSVTTLLACNVDDNLTNLDLPYMSIIGSTTGVDYFDNVTVSVVPEPSMLLLLGFGGLTLLRKRKS